jgi:hypothetical protein
MHSCGVQCGRLLPLGKVPCVLEASYPYIYHLDPRVGIMVDPWVCGSKEPAVEGKL